MESMNDGPGRLGSGSVRAVVIVSSVDSLDPGAAALVRMEWPP